MGSKRRNPSPGGAVRETSSAVDARTVRFSGQMVRMDYLPPEMLARFNEVLPGSARELLDNSLAESSHRRKLESDFLSARNASLAYQDKSAFRSDALGQCLGFALGLCCAGIAATLAWFKPDAWMVAVAIAAMPALTIGVKVVIDSRHLHKLKTGDSQN